jgi:hypothetical protein
VLVYVGPSLDADQVLERIPEAIVRPPANQSDLISDVLALEPTHVLLIDGNFASSLSVWQKEIVYALQIPGVRAIYGAASMGALRAADLSEFGMIGSGRIFRWYDEGVITDESEVSVMYYPRPDGSYVTTTIPLVNVRAALDAAVDAEAIEPEYAGKVFEFARSVPWQERTTQLIARLGEGLMGWIDRHDQKKIDALELVCTFQELKPRPVFATAKPENLSLYFSAQFERDRQVSVNGTPIALQHLDAFIMLHDVDYAQKLMDANNRKCALLLADMYRVTVNQADFDAQWARFCARLSLTTAEMHQDWMRQNNINLKEFCRLMLEDARMHKLHRALNVVHSLRRNTQRLFDYLRTSDSYAYWAGEAACQEERIRRRGEESISLDLENNPHQLMLSHLQRTGLSIAGSLESYAAECGFGTLPELVVALERDRLGIEEETHA